MRRSTYLAHEGGDPYDVPKGQYCRGDSPNSTYEIQGREVVLVLRDRTVVRFPFTVDKQFLTLEGASFYGEAVKHKRVTDSGELPRSARADQPVAVWEEENVEGC